jgi:hypothetical protein
LTSSIKFAVSFNRPVPSLPTDRIVAQDEKNSATKIAAVIPGLDLGATGRLNLDPTTCDIGVKRLVTSKQFQKRRLTRISPTGNSPVVIFLFRLGEQALLIEKQVFFVAYSCERCQQIRFAPCDNF